MNPSSHEPQAHAASSTDGTVSPTSQPPLPPSISSMPPPPVPVRATPTADEPISPITPITPITPATPTPYPQPTAPGPDDSPPPSSSATATQAGPSKPSSPILSRKLLSTHIAAHPDETVGQAIRHQFPYPNPVKRLVRRFKVKHSIIHGLTSKEEKRWTEEGPEIRRKAGWKLRGEEGEGVECGELFWKMYMSLLPTLQRDPLAGLVPPDLLGSTTTMPLSIISLIPDIMQHYHDVIIRAEKEVFLATNYWQPSNSVSTISQTLRELSALVVKQNRPKVVVKLMYDRGTWEQLWNSHAPVKSSTAVPLNIPAPEDVPGLHLEVVNFHKVLLGTFHAKFLIVDRKVALINSNNIQDRPNLELMSHLEGPIVDSFYEIALHSWYNRLSPPLPFINKPFEPPRDALGRVQYLFSDHNPYFDDIEVLKAARAARILLRRQTQDIDAEKARHHEHGGERFRHTVRKVVDQQRQSLADWKPGEDMHASVQNAMHELREFRDRLASGLPGASSRAGSRGPSRRASSTDVRMHKPSSEFGGGVADVDPADSETMENTASNAKAVSTLPHPVDPSDVSSSPTVHVDAPTKSKTFPVQHHDHPHPSPGLAPLAVDETQPSPRNRVIFLNDGDATASPVDMKPSSARNSIRGVKPMLLESAGMIESPMASSIRLADPGRPSPGPSPILRPTPGRRDSPGPSPLLRPTHGGSEPRHIAISDSLPSSPVTATATHAPAKDAGGNSLPLTARMPDEVPPAPTEIPPTPADHVPEPARETSADMPALEKKESKPIRWDKAGGTKLVRAESEMPPEGKGSKRMYQMSKMFNAAGVLSEAWATVEDSDELDNFRPHVVHAPHDPFPIAMCCRKPHGLPGHHDIRNPQNAAWLAGFRYAKKRVFVQSPTLNARPIVRAVKQACRRGVEVVLLLDLGFNDKGESIPFQGGTNEEVVDRLYKKLGPEGKAQYLKVYWYTGKDQVRPLNAVYKQRNCHIKFASYDDEVMIIGNGNQDSQSWFHSQEVNIMIDNKQVIAEMMDVLLGNQNTMQYGLVSEDGIWRDKDGKTLEDWGAPKKGAFRGLSQMLTFAKAI